MSLAIAPDAFCVASHIRTGADAEADARCIQLAWLLADALLAWLAAFPRLERALVGEAANVAILAIDAERLLPQVGPGARYSPPQFTAHRPSAGPRVRHSVVVTGGRARRRRGRPSGLSAACGLAGETSEAMADNTPVFSLKFLLISGNQARFDRKVCA